MKRRDVLRSAGVLCAGAIVSRARAAEANGGWRGYALRYEVDLARRRGPGRVWLPVPQDAPGWQRFAGFTWGGNATRAAVARDPVYGAQMLVAEWDTPNCGYLEATAKVAVHDRAGGNKSELSAAERALWLAPTPSMPTDGIVAERSAAIVKGVRGVDAQARAIYDWVVDNTFRDPKVVGCGTGNIRAMLETGNLGGKCADINSLFVGLARAANIPAREVYGLRAGESTLFKCLGKSGGDVTAAQHCRAEYLSPSQGWVPVDPADVRKVVLDEGLALDDARVLALRKRLFGSWEMNWIAFNSARDFTPPPGTRAALPYLMYPYAETADATLDGRDASAFVYHITSTVRLA